MKKKLAVAGLTTMIFICLAITYRNLAPVQDDGYRSARERAVIKKFDEDGDGELSRKEEKKAEKAMAKQRAEWITKFDTNGDGKISAEEKGASKRGSQDKKGERSAPLQKK
jgi:hypothetical protein